MMIQDKLTHDERIRLESFMAALNFHRAYYPSQHPALDAVFTDAERIQAWLEDTGSQLVTDPSTPRGLVGGLGGPDPEQVVGDAPPAGSTIAGRSWEEHQALAATGDPGRASNPPVSSDPLASPHGYRSPGPRAMPDNPKA